MIISQPMSLMYSMANEESAGNCHHKAFMFIPCVTAMPGGQLNYKEQRINCVKLKMSGLTPLRFRTKNFLSALQHEHHIKKANMNTKLNHNPNWLELAKQANWSAAALAIKCGVSVRTLHRHFCKQMGKNTKVWLDEQRQHQAVKLLCDGSSIKEAASSLGYSQPNNFSRQYKKYWGHLPSQQTLNNNHP
jgi:AraC-like DNA-binding protein